MLKTLKRLARDDAGATAIEYGLIASLISVAIVSAVGLAGTRLTGMFDTVAAAL